jgi:hypothetical protein
MHNTYKHSLALAVLALATSSNLYAAESVAKTGVFAEFKYNVVDTATAVVDYGNVKWDPKVRFGHGKPNMGLRAGYSAQNWRGYIEINPSKRAEKGDIESGFINGNININPDGSKTQINNIKVTEQSVGMGGDYIWNVTPNNRVYVGGSLRLSKDRTYIYTCGFPLAAPVSSVWTAQEKFTVVPTFEGGYQYALDNGLYFGLETRYTPKAGNLNSALADYPGKATAPGNLEPIAFKDAFQVALSIGYVF